MRGKGVLLLALLAWRTAAQETQAPSPRPLVGLALGGGSARGLAHVGVLQVLEEHGIPVDRIAGTSMGACVGSLYASGYTAEGVAGIARGIDWERIFRGRSDRRYEPVGWRVDDVPAVGTLGVRRGRLQAPSAALSDYRVGRLLFEHLAGPGVHAGGDFDRLPIPFRAVATDLKTGERVVLARGDLARSVRASMSLPVVFPPVEVDGRLLVDGGLVDNVPTGVAREMGAAIVIAVEVGAPPTELTEDVGLFEIVGRLTEFMMSRGNYGLSLPPDVRIRPDLKGFEGTDFERYDEAVAAGRAAALAALPQIETLLAGRKRQPTHGAREQLPATGVLADVRIEGLRQVQERVVLRRLRIRPGDDFAMARALAGLDAVWASNLFSSAWLALAPHPDGQLGLTASVREHPATRASLGLSYNESDNASAFLRLRNGNLLGTGERLDLLLRVDSGQARFDATLGSAGLGGSALGYRVGLQFSEDKPPVYGADGERLGRTRFRHQLLGARIERAIGSLALLGAGLVGGRSELDERTGIPFEARTDTIAKGVGRLVADTLDDRFYSTRGLRLDLQAEHSLPALGASLDYGRAWGRFDGFLPVGSRGLLEAHAFGGIAGSAAPEYDFHRVGGPELIPGRSRDELWGRWAGALGVGLGVRLSPTWRIVARGGAGNAWPRREDMRLDDLRAGASIGVAHSTRLGPMSLDLGVGASKFQVHVALGFQ